MSEPHATFELDLAGQRWEIRVSETELETVHRPLLRLMLEAARPRAGRYIVFLAGAASSGKTATAALWETLARQMGADLPLQVLPMDGFHRPNAELAAETATIGGEILSLRDLKGLPHTFDLDSLADRLRRLRAGERTGWPRYDRRIHDPVPDALWPPERGIALVEGIFLLLDEPGWRDLRAQADLTLFIECPEAVRRAAQIARHRRGGRTPTEARARWERVDRPNGERVRAHRCPPDILLRVREGRRMSWERSGG